MGEESFKLLVTGATGFVAGNVLRQAPADLEVHALSRGAASLKRLGLRWHSFDPLDSGRLEALFRTVRPDAVIHAAALADIDYCEAHPEEARAVNVELTRSLAGMCTTYGARFVHCSTDTIFDGEHPPYREDSPPGPVNFYARTKVEAEQLVARICPAAVIARLSLVVGLPVAGTTNSFLAKWLATLRAGKQLNAFTHEVRTPIDVITLSRALLELSELSADSFAGVVHLAGNDWLSRFEMAQRIAARFGLDQRLIVASYQSAIANRAPRPRDVSLDNSKTRAILRTPMLSFEEALTALVGDDVRSLRSCL
jgi:dTDP-4-dehydrorhamnose reductase